MSKLKINHEKLNELGFDDEGWVEVCKILDDPKISQEEKDEASKKYLDDLLKAVDAKIV
ncbi:MAG: hypothetical protein Q4P14_00950 [Methanobacteriaceae archaeon]|nr:hypothetical protein [Methanobacteriaceae archaeon]